MREPRGNLEGKLESVARAKRRELRPELRKVSWRELKNELARGVRLLRNSGYGQFTVVSLNGRGGEENLEKDS